MAFQLIDRKINLTDDEIINNICQEGTHYISPLLNYKFIGKQRDVISIEEIESLIDLAYKENWIALDLSNCGLREVPPSICKLKSLKVLDFGNSPADNLKNKFTALPDNFSDLENLIFLGLYEVPLKKLPKNFEKLHKLRYLNMNGCKLKVFPKEISLLSSLQLLCLGISSPDFTLPPDIKGLINLKALYMPESSIELLPDEIGCLKNLEVLYLGRSKLRAIPNTLINLTELARFDIEKTPLSRMISPEILKQTASEIINFIIRFQSITDIKILHESKMIIVGQGGVGKTCLLNRILHNSYVENVSTEGIDISKWNYKNEGQNYDLNIWDFGGQEIYHSTHQFFLTKRSLYVFVWDSRQEDEYGRIDYWLNTIQSFADDSPIIIAINKCDKNRKNCKQIDIITLKEKYKQIVDIYYVSCKDDIGIEELKFSIIRAATNLPLMQTIWFASWINVRRHLEEERNNKNIITYKEYLELCKLYAIDDNEALSLIKYLHDLGVVLYFYEDVLLKNVVILDPEWGTHAVYKILDAQSNILKNRNGILHYSDLQNIWVDSKQYPQEVYLYLLKLMNRFQLSFLINENETYLVAGLLLNNKIKLEKDFDFKNTINFSYYYDFLPAGIMTRFIVKAHKYLLEISGTKQCWLKGAYLNYKNSYALVELHDGIVDRYINICVSGGSRRTQSELMQTIRTTFYEIHETIPRISFAEKVRCNCSENCQFLYDYKYLLRLEENNIEDVRCEKTIRLIKVAQLLDGFKEEKRRENMNGIHIDVSPTIINNVSSSAQNKNDISIEINNQINELQGLLNELKDEIGSNIEGYENDFKKVYDNLGKVATTKDKDEIIKSGLLNRVKRLIDECSNADSTLGKFVAGTKYGYAVLADIAIKYNSIAEWLGLPIVPKMLLPTK